jgi:hypothetical protein
MPKASPSVAVERRWPSSGVCGRRRAHAPSERGTRPGLRERIEVTVNVVSGVCGRGQVGKGWIRCQLSFVVCVWSPSSPRAVCRCRSRQRRGAGEAPNSCPRGTVSRSLRDLIQHLQIRDISSTLAVAVPSRSLGTVPMPSTASTPLDPAGTLAAAQTGGSRGPGSAARTPPPRASRRRPAASPAAPAAAPPGPALPARPGPTPRYC